MEKLLPVIASLSRASSISSEIVNLLAISLKKETIGTLTESPAVFLNSLETIEINSSALLIRGFSSFFAAPRGRLTPGISKAVSAITKPAAIGREDDFESLTPYLPVSKSFDNLVDLVPTS